MAATKFCPKCGDTKELSDFYKCSRSSDGVGGYCKDCAKSSALDSYRKHANDPEERERKAAANKASYLKNREARLAHAKEHRVKPAVRQRLKETYFQRSYGISLDKYEAMTSSQGGVCAICRESCQSGNALAVDHDHATGQVRGLLCSNCNRAVGMFRDDPDRLMDAATYVMAHRNILSEIQNGT